MRAAIAIVGIGLLLGAGYWAYRGLQAFRYALGDYAPTPYEVSEEGRSRLGEALEWTRRVQWTLSDGSVQNAFYRPSRNGAVIVYAHGSPDNGLGLMPEARALAEAGYGAVLVDLPGYGESEGRRAWDEKFLESIRLAVDFAVAQPETDDRRIGGHGYSNGGCLMARAAAADPRLSALVLVAAYSNLGDQLKHSFGRRIPGLGAAAIAAGLWSGVPVSELDTVRALRQIGMRKTLIVAGGQDQAIPVEMAEQLQSASSSAEMIIFDEMNHVGFAGRLGDAYLGPLEVFWDGALAVTDPL